MIDVKQSFFIKLKIQNTVLVYFCLFIYCSIR